MASKKQPTKVSTTTILSKIQSHWSPKLIGSLNNAYEIKLAKLSGDFIWHSHPQTDELFFILSGILTIKFREPGGNQELNDVVLGPGEMIVIPKGVRHCPVTMDGEEVAVMLFEPTGVVNTGDAPVDGLTNAVEDFRHLCEK
jgi:mannose-6-phosphate isomerase-like protein (cupin superfamily)